MDTTPDDFRIKPLREDRDALLLIGLALVIALLVLIGLAFLPDAAWERLQDRSKLLWGALVAAAPIMLVAYQRLGLRKEAVKALGKAASAPVSLEVLSADLEGVSANPPVAEPVAAPAKKSNRRK